ncbi:MAG: hypothetical protein VYC17_06645 [Nitrospinota bacterium]|nr:hypothetical protein [Nitrospinota bacterium]
MRKFIITWSVFLSIFCATQAFCLELLVFSGEKSKNSKSWGKEVLPGYAETKYKESLPLKIFPIEGRNFPDWFYEALQQNRVGEIIGTPTFIIWDEKKGREAGRVEGYTQKSKFYSRLEEALAMIDQGLTPGRREGSGGDHRHEGSREDHMEEGSGAPRQYEGSGEDHRAEGSGGGRHNEGSSMSQDIMDHIYDTPEEAKRASEMLGLGGEIHSHETPTGTIYMPGATM